MGSDNSFRVAVPAFIFMFVMMLLQVILFHIVFILILQ